MIKPDPYIVTYTGKKVYPLNPQVEDICIEDIAHALANKCRFTGHVDRFYSIAEHSVLMSRMVSKQAKKQALLHDASEAYLPDVASPIKKFFPLLIEAEKKILHHIETLFLLPETFASCKAEVKEADVAIREKEIVLLMPTTFPLTLQQKCNLTNQPIFCWTPTIAEHEFKATFCNLFGKEQMR